MPSAILQLGHCWPVVGRVPITPLPGTQLDLIIRSVCFGEEESLTDNSAVSKNLVNRGLPVMAAKRTVA